MNLIKSNVYKNKSELKQKRMKTSNLCDVTNDKTCV